MFAYGMLAVILALHLEALGFDRTAIGILFTLTLVGDTCISLLLTTRADRFGRKGTLAIGAGLMVFASVVFATTGNFWLLVVAATIGVLSPSGNEIGPFLPVEQAALSEELPKDRRVTVFAWYNLAGYFAAALGSFAGGWGASALQAAGRSAHESYRIVILGHGVIAVALLVCYLPLSSRAEASQETAATKSRLGLGESRSIVLRLSALFSLDAFAGGFVMQSLIAYWFHLRWHANEAQLGTLLLFGNLCAGLSSLVAGRLAKRFGLVNTMVWTHIPSNALLILVPFMPSYPLALGVLLARFCLSQMDVPTRQAYVMSVVKPDERSAAGGVTNVARSVGVSLSPLLLGALFAAPTLGLPLIAGGAIKIVYDLALWRMCRATAPDL
jgi:MFS family permease